MGRARKTAGARSTGSRTITCPTTIQRLLVAQRTNLAVMRDCGMTLLKQLESRANPPCEPGQDTASPAPGASEIIESFGTLVLGITRIIDKERQSFAPIQRPASGSRTGPGNADKRDADQRAADQADIERRIADELDRIAARVGQDAGGQEDSAEA